MHKVIRNTFSANDENAGGRLEIKKQVQHHYEAILEMHTDLEKIKQYKDVYPVLEQIKKEKQAEKQKLQVASKKKKKKKKLQKLNFPIFSKTTLKQQDEFRMIYNTFKKINTLNKGTVDMSCPETFKLKKNVLNQPKWKKEQQFINEEHEANIYNEIGKIKSAIALPLDLRKKNEFDPIAYPSFHIKKEKQKEFYDQNGVHFSDIHKQPKKSQNKAEKK